MFITTAVMAEPIFDVLCLTNIGGGDVRPTRYTDDTTLHRALMGVPDPGPATTCHYVEHHSAAPRWHTRRQPNILHQLQIPHAPPHYIALHTNMQLKLI